MATVKDIPCYSAATAAMLCHQCCTNHVPTSNDNRSHPCCMADLRELRAEFQRFRNRSFEDKHTFEKEIATMKAGMKRLRDELHALGAATASDGYGRTASSNDRVMPPASIRAAAPTNWSVNIPAEREEKLSPSGGPRKRLVKPYEVVVRETTRKHLPEAPPLTDEIFIDVLTASKAGVAGSELSLLAQPRKEGTNRKLSCGSQTKYSRVRQESSSSASGGVLNKASSLGADKTGPLANACELKPCPFTDDTDSSTSSDDGCTVREFSSPPRMYSSFGAKPFNYVNYSATKNKPATAVKGDSIVEGSESSGSKPPLGASYSSISTNATTSRSPSRDTTSANLRSPRSKDRQSCSTPRSRSKRSSVSDVFGCTKVVTEMPLNRDVILAPHTAKRISKHQGRDEDLRCFLSNQAGAHSKYTKLIPLMYCKHDLSVHCVDGVRLVFFKDKVYIPEKLRAKTLEYYFDVHPADFAGLRLMENCIWPGVDQTTSLYRPGRPLARLTAI